MKGIVISFIISLFLFGCSGQSPTDSNYSNLGEVKLAFKSSEIPSDVAFIKAVLTREGHEPLEKELDLSTATLTEIVIEKIEPGSWNLVVEAYNSNGEIIYSGTSDVEIFADQVTQVSIALQRTNSGLGAVIINIVWVNPGNYNWSDVANNPILTNDGISEYVPFGVWQSFVIFDDGIYKMWYSGLSNSAKCYIFYATSEDGINWIKNSNGPILSPTFDNSWDAASVNSPVVIKENNLYKMYYTGFSNQYETWSIGLAVSNDGINWERQGENPIISGDINNWTRFINPTDIEVVNGQYYLYFTGRESNTTHKIGLAKSNDGVNFSLVEYPILRAQLEWESTGVSNASIFKKDNKYFMIYMNVNSPITGFGYAQSEDGVNWQRVSNSPFFTDGMTKNQNDRIIYPNYLSTPSRNYIYYTADPAESDIFSLNVMVQEN